eukprot:6759215-Pyramimonas_sp.AAC.1
MEYDKKSAKAKKDFKRDWAIEQFDRYQKQKEHCTSLVQKKKEWAELCNFDVIVDREGGHHSQAAIIGAYNYCVMAASIGWYPCGKRSGGGRYLLS